MIKAIKDSILRYLAGALLTQRNDDPFGYGYCPVPIPFSFAHQDTAVVETNVADQQVKELTLAKAGIA